MSLIKTQLGINTNEVRDSWVTLFEILIVTAVGGYFTLRSAFDKRNNPM